MRTPVLVVVGRWAALVAAMAGVVTGCATAPPAPPPQPSPDVSVPTAPQAKAPPAATVLTPAESTFSQGVKAYQAAQYTVAETQLKNALQLGLTVPGQAATAHKHLAFIYCTSRREALCAAAFKAARAADPSFALTKSEAGHPMWGPVYRKALRVKPRH